MDNVPAEQSEQRLYLELVTGFKTSWTVIRQLALMVGFCCIHRNRRWGCVMVV